MAKHSLKTVDFEQQLLFIFFFIGFSSSCTSTKPYFEECERHVGRTGPANMADQRMYH